ncbi:tetratricopeptide repeat protein [uncultured Hydrogenophaga sp.]|uniref:tetratricopeptide repeat protein n=1 Tax=uncultured Hydrogenophaga sp. TaxID=199683 RepID=UPI002585162B|nr:tetratricopeptide repeat protein [uncultured Hydrogenophaga sp.]
MSVHSLAIAWCLALPLAVGAAGAPPSSDLPDLSGVRERIYRGQFAQAVTQLRELARTVRHAEVYNLLGYSLRELKRYGEAAHWYREALLYDPEHRPTLEYQGELFLALGDVAGARRNLRYLELLCGRECAEYRLLRKAVVDAGHAVGDPR